MLNCRFARGSVSVTYLFERGGDQILAKVAIKQQFDEWLQSAGPRLEATCKKQFKNMKNGGVKNIRGQISELTSQIDEIYCKSNYYFDLGSNKQNIYLVI